MVGERTAVSTTVLRKLNVSPYKEVWLNGSCVFIACTMDDSLASILERGPPRGSMSKVVADLIASPTSFSLCCGWHYKSVGAGMSKNEARGREG